MCGNSKITVFISLCTDVFVAGQFFPGGLLQNIYHIIKLVGKSPTEQTIAFWPANTLIIFYFQRPRFFFCFPQIESSSKGLFWHLKSNFNLGLS